MKNKIIALVLGASLVWTTTGWVVSNDTNQDLTEIVVNKDKKINKQSTKIANLKTVIVEKGNELKAQQTVIDEQKLQLNKQTDNANKASDKARKLKEENDRLKDQLEEAEAKAEQVNFKKTTKGSDVGGKKVSRVAPKATNESIGQFEMTSYIAMCREGCTGVTRTGINIKNTTTYQGHRIIATDPSVIPLYSIVRIHTQSGSFTAISLDTGGGINGHEIDYLVSSESEAGRNGRQVVKVEMIRNGK